jgi:hypothetical protein
MGGQGFFMRARSRLFELKWGRKGPSGRERSVIAALVEEHREDLIKEWEEKVCQRS